MEKVYEGNKVDIYRLSPALYFRRSDLARGQCNNAYLVDGDGVGIVDVSTIEAAAEYEDEADRLFGKPIRRIFLTHGDGDHVDGLPAFLDRDVTVYCSRRLYGDLDPARKQCRASFVEVGGSMRLSLPGGMEAELFTLPDPTHSPWDMFIRIPAERTLCAGDAVVEYQTLYYHNANADVWAASLRELARRGDSWVIPGHGPVYPYSYIGGVADFIDTVLWAARQCFARLDPTELAGISAGKVDETVGAYFAQGGADAEAILEKAGPADAARQVRMVLWRLIQPTLR